MINIADIKPAPYNPRKINQAQFELLKKSISNLGLVIPVLVNKQNNMIIAGHQRTKAAKAVGIKEVPAFFVNGVNKYDEARFNQFHNASDDYKSGTGIINTNANGFVELQADQFEIKDVIAGRVKSICRILIKYGNVLSCVVENNKVIYNPTYVKACQLLNLKVNAFCMNAKYKDDYMYLNSDYGVYSYENLPKNTYVQGLAQMTRLPNNGKKQQSHLYKYFVIPYLNKTDKRDFLDFGAGKAEYANKLKGTAVEFYPHHGNTILYKKANAMIEDLKKHLKEKGKFGFVVCDSVVNSTNNMKAEMAVLRCLSIFSKGPIFISGRRLEKVIASQNSKKAVDNVNYDYFLDENNFTSSFRKGQWYYQHFHTRKTIESELKKVHLKIVKYREDASAFQLMAVKEKELSRQEAKSAIDYEFDLPLPNGKTYQQNKEMWNLVEKFYPN